MKKIQPWSTQDGRFHTWHILDSDLSQDAKILFLVLNSLPSRTLPPSEELRTYTSVKKRPHLRRAFKELELRGCLEFATGTIVLKDRVLPAPVGEVLPLPKDKQLEPPDPDFNVFKAWYGNEFLTRFGENYPFAGGKDGQAVKTLLKNYGLEGAKAKAVAAWTSNNNFFFSSGKSIARLAQVASQLVAEQILSHQISDPTKWKGHKTSEMKLGGTP